MPELPVDPTDILRGLEQGGTADDVRRIFGDALPRAVPSVSREVLRHGPDVAALRAAVLRLAEQFAVLRV